MSDAVPCRFADAFDRAHEAVIAETGADDFGADDYKVGLNRLLQSMDSDPQFTDAGRSYAWGQVLSVLRGRAEAVRSMKAHPGFDAHPIISPVVITGIPRTGTTALHRLLAVDPRFQGLQTWLLDSPMPRPPMDSWGEYPQFRQSIANLDAHYALAPDARAAHHRAAGEVHECCMLLRQSFVSNLWTCGWTAPSYDTWWQGASEAAAYRWFRNCVALIGFTEPDKRWLLKNPGHIENLDLLFAVFPDAKVIQTHRDPAKAVPSLVSLLTKRHEVIETSSKAERTHIMLRREVQKWAGAVRKADAVRADHPGQVLDVRHADLHRDAMAVLDRIYDFIAMELPEDSRSAMAQRIADKPELSRGAHRYHISDFGMTEAEAREPFGDYLVRHDLLEIAR
jgi:hypothetical protein